MDIFLQRGSVIHDRILIDWLRIERICGKLWVESAEKQIKQLI